MTRVYLFKLSYYYFVYCNPFNVLVFRVSRNAFLRPESVCKVTALFCLCQKVRQCLTLFNFSAPRLACRRRHFRKASAKVRPFSSTAKFFRTFFRGFFCQNRPSDTQNAIIPQYSTANIFMRVMGAMRIMRVMGIMGITGVMRKRQRGSASSKSDVYAEK